MGLATHLGPWLLGSVKNTTGTTAGTVRNTGATIVAQSADIGSTVGTGTLFWLPAGAQILRASAIVTTAYTGTAPTLALTVGGTSFVTAVTPSASIAVQSLTVNTTGVPLAKNVGTADVAVAYTLGGTITAGAATIVVEYVVRNADGSYQPTTFTA